MNELSLWQEIKQHPLSMLLAILLHLLLVAVLIFSVRHVDKPASAGKKQPEQKTVQAVVVDAQVVDRELQKLRKIEQNKKNREAARQKKLKAEARKAREKRRKEEKRLANLKKKQKQQQQAARELQNKLDKEREKKQQELTALKQKQQQLQQQQKEMQQQQLLLEKKRQAEQQKLAAIESRRKAEEAAALKKKQAAEAELRRQRELAELKRRMAEEEKRQLEQNSRLKTLRAQYVKLIQQQVARNWLPPSNMVKGWTCEVMVQQNILGDVTQVQMLKCNGSAAFKSTVERAVKKASPLPAAPDPKVFEKRIQFIFDPKI